MLRVGRVRAWVALAGLAAPLVAIASCSGESAIVLLFPDAADEAYRPPPPVSPFDDAGDAAYDGPPPRYQVLPQEVDFGAAPCAGPGPAAQNVVLTNKGLLRMRFSARTIEPQSFVVKSPSTGSVGVGQSVALTVFAQPVLATAEAGKPIVGALVVDIDDTLRFGTISVPLRVTPSGAMLSVAPLAVSFGLADVGASKQQEIAIENKGTQPAVVTFVQPADDSLSLDWTAAPSSVQIAPGGSVQGAVARFRPTTAGVHTGSIEVHASGVLCGGDLPRITLTGTGVAVDAGADAEAGSSADAAADAEAGTDAGADAEAGTDAGVEAGAGAEAGADAASDANADAIADAPSDG